MQAHNLFVTLRRSFVAKHIAHTLNFSYSLYIDKKFGYKYFWLKAKKSAHLWSDLINCNIPYRIDLKKLSLKFKLCNVGNHQSKNCIDMSGDCFDYINHMNRNCLNLQENKNLFIIQWGKDELRQMAATRRVLTGSCCQCYTNPLSLKIEIEFENTNVQCKVLNLWIIKNKKCIHFKKCLFAVCVLFLSPEEYLTD